MDFWHQIYIWQKLTSPEFSFVVMAVRSEKVSNKLVTQVGLIDQSVGLLLFSLIKSFSRCFFCRVLQFFCLLNFYPVLE